MKRDSNGSWFIKGAKDGVPIGLGYFAVAFTLGIAAKKAGMNPFQAGVMSATMLASAGQFAAINIIATGGGYLQMAMTTLIVNLRYLLMSCALSQKLDSRTKLIHRFGISYFVTDEIFGISVGCEKKLNPFYPYGAGLVAAPGWTLGAVLGAALGAIMPERLQNAMSVALYGMFLSIIIPAAKKQKEIAIIIIVSMILSYIFSVVPGLRQISSGMRIILLTVLIAGAAAFICPMREEEERDEA